MKKQKVAPEEQGAPELKPKSKCQTNTMNKKAREMLQDSIRAINMSVLVSEVVTTLKEQCCDGSLATFGNELCETNELLKDLVDYHHDIFATLYFFNRAHTSVSSLTVPPSSSRSTTCITVFFNSNLNMMSVSKRRQKC